MNMAEKCQEEILVPKNLTEAKKISKQVEHQGLKDILLYVCTWTRWIESKPERMTSRILQRTVYTGKRNASTDVLEKVRSQKPTFKRKRIDRFGNNSQYGSKVRPAIFIHHRPAA